MGEVLCDRGCSKILCKQGLSHEAANSQASVLASLLLTHFRNASLPSKILQAAVEGLDGGIAASPDTLGTRRVQAEIPQLQPGTFIVSLLKRGRFKRLHRAGKCSLSPGVGYKSLEVFGT